MQLHTLHSGDGLARQTSYWHDAYRRAGASLQSQNAQDGTGASRACVIHTDNDLVDLTIMTTTHAPHSTVGKKSSEVVHTNQKHPFYTLERGFIPVRNLKLGMHVLRADGQIGVITGWKVVPGAKAMYNLEVAHDHAFTVSAGQWVVHNSCGGSITDTSQLDINQPSQLTYGGTISSGGRSGDNRPLYGTPDSYVQTSGGHALVYDSQGRLLYDIDTNRVKMTT